MAHPVLTIGQISTRTGLAPSAIRFYEEVGLVRAIRTEAGQRRFRRSDIRRLSFVIAAQGFGLTLGEIREMLSKLPDERTPTKSDWTRISRRFRARVDDEITRLQSLRDRLDGCIGCGCLSLKSCRLYNPDDTAATRGSGPRYVMGDNPET
ncbi:MAG: redox-sensitive transcriptional activator SoxR [Pseudomonadota bacterium]